MIIGIDVDDTSLALMPEWLKRSNNKYGGNYTPDQITQWEISKLVSYGNKIFEFLSDEDLYDNIDPVEGALEGITKLKDMGHRVVFITAGMHKGKYLRLKQLGFLDREEDYIEARDKSLILTDILVDDRPFNLWQFKGKYTILFEKPAWSKDEDIEYRAKDWKEVVKIVKRISKLEKNA